MRYLQKTEYDWQFSAKAKRYCLGYPGGCSLPRGKMLGGCDSLNGIVVVRGNDRDYDDWERMGNPTWNWENVLKYFKKSEGNQNMNRFSNTSGKYHSANGQLIIDSFGENHPFGKVVTAAAKELGYNQLDDLVPYKWLGYIYAQGTLHNGRREGVAKNFLASASNRPNLHVIKNGLVEKIEIVDKKAVKVHFSYKGKNMTAKNKKDVILSAGALSSPQILMLSGIGPEKHLQEFNIEVNANLSVGKNHQDHATLMIFFQLELNNSSEYFSLQNLDNTYNIAIHNSGPLSALGLRNLLAFLNTTSKYGYPDVGLQHFYFERGTSDIEGYANGLIEPAKWMLLEQNKKTDMLGIAISLYRPKSRGTVKLSGNSITDKPDIDLNFLDYNEEIEIFVRSIKQQVTLTTTKAYKKIGAKFMQLPIPTCRGRNLDEYYRCYVHNFCRSNHHHVGTSKMGPKSDPDAVVDSHLRVIGIDNLREIDAGIMPLIPSANTNLPTIMVAEKGADFIKMDWL